jgi:hypothetical protein
MAVEGKLVGGEKEAVWTSPVVKKNEMRAPFASGRCAKMPVFLQEHTQSFSKLKFQVRPPFTSNVR